MTIIGIEIRAWRSWQSETWVSVETETNTRPKWDRDKPRRDWDETETRQDKTKTRPRQDQDKTKMGQDVNETRAQLDKVCLFVSSFFHFLSLVLVSWQADKLYFIHGLKLDFISPPSSNSICNNAMLIFARYFWSKWMGLVNCLFSSVRIWTHDLLVVSLLP